MGGAWLARGLPSHRVSCLWPRAQSRVSKFESFFGPGVRAKLTEITGGVDVALISDGSAAGGITEDQEVLPPLMPGLAPRVVKKTTKSE